MNETQINDALGGKTVCARIGTTNENERWQEFHAVTPIGLTGVLSELGNSPSGEVVGTWRISGTGVSAQVIYDYGTGGTYAYSVCQQASDIHFCGATNVTNATTIIGSVPCP
ncbi:MAG: hypothetical protein WA049_17785 [Ferribacterium limneticum]